MKEEKLFDIEIRVAVTGQSYSVKDIPADATVQEVLNAFLSSCNINPGLGAAWKLLCGAMVVSNNTVLSTLIGKNTTFELIAKIEGA